jgi:hypothetical protein
MSQNGYSKEWTITVDPSPAERADASAGRSGARQIAKQLSLSY